MANPKELKVTLLKSKHGRLKSHKACVVGLGLVTLETEVRKGMKNGGNVEAAAIVGARIAEKAKTAGIDTVAFDRSGFRYHGRVKALADAAREAGLKF